MLPAPGSWLPVLAWLWGSLYHRGKSTRRDADNVGRAEGKFSSSSVEEQVVLSKRCYRSALICEDVLPCGCSDV